MDFGLIVHGGAWSIPDQYTSDHTDGVSGACSLGYELLEKGRDAIDVVEAVICLLEDDPTFDAGIGSHFNSNAEVEMDAIIADQNYRIGSVCAIQNIKNPIRAARLVRDESEHILLAGKGATDFALTQGLDFTTTETFLIGREKETYERLKHDTSFSTKDPFKSRKQGFGTVGTVVKDKSGQLAIGVSTGGTPKKLAGRIGDTPIWGAGGYVQSHGGAAATGFGEDLMRVLITSQVVNMIEMGLHPQQAAEKAIALLEREVSGLGGIITLSQESFGLAFNTKRMAYAVQTSDISLHVGIEPSDLENLLSSTNI